MNEIVLALVADYGVPLLFSVTFLSCLALPVPSSLLMLASGGFAATGDLSLPSVTIAAYCGAILGDNTGYWIARGLGERVSNWLITRPKRAALRRRAERFMQHWGGSSVFFSCWLVAPLGPYVNYVSGLTKFSWLRFALWGALGEVFWVGLYVGIGYGFADNITEVASLLSNLSGFIVALVVSIGLGVWLAHASRARDKTRAGKSHPEPHI